MIGEPNLVFAATIMCRSLTSTTKGSEKKVYCAMSVSLQSTYFRLSSISDEFFCSRFIRFLRSELTSQLKLMPFFVNLAIPPPHPYLHFCLGPLCLSLWNRSFQTMLLALAKLFLCMSMELTLNIMIYHLISVISVNQSWESDRNEYNQPPGRGSSWFGPNFTEDGYRRGNPKKRTSRSFQSMSISLSTLLLYMSKTCLSLI